MNEWQMIELSLMKRNLSVKRIDKFRAVYDHMRHTLKKHISKVHKSDTTKFYLWMIRKEFSDETKKSYWCCAKNIIRVFHPKADFSDYKPKFKKVIKFSEDILTKDEVVVLINTTENLRDRALISMLYESGARTGEILGLKVRDVSQDCLGYIIIVNGKTGMRRIRLTGSSQMIKNYFDMHRWKNDPDSAFFYRHDKRDKRPLSYTAVNKIVKYYAQKVGIQKRIYPYLFRHTRATHLAKYLTESEMRIYFGWSASSEMAGVYVHLSGRDIEDKIISIADQISLKMSPTI